jgi:hypothetical protein
MVYKIEKDEESGKFKLYNKDKKTYAKRMFATKETAQKMADRYTDFAHSRKKPKVKEEPKED